MFYILFNIFLFVPQPILNHSIVICNLLQSFCLSTLYPSSFSTPFIFYLCKSSSSHSASISLFLPDFSTPFYLYFQTLLLYYTGHFLSLPFQLRCTVKLCFLPLQDFHSYKKVARGILPLIPIRGRGKLPQHRTSFEICCQKRLLFLGVT